jgi:hypothetical protein
VWKAKAFYIAVIIRGGSKWRKKKWMNLSLYLI